MPNWKPFLLAPALYLASVGLNAQAPADSQFQPAAESQVRVVRISQVIGHVQMDRGTGQGFEAGFINLPVVEGARIRTLKDAWTEIEFEDNSTLRMTPNSEVAFAALHRDADGQPVSEIDCKGGTMYLSLAKGDAGNFLVRAEGKTLSFREGSHVRLDLYPGGSLLVVVKGAATVKDTSGTTIVDKGKALTFDVAGAPAQAVRSRDQQPGLYDAWDAAATQYHETHAANGFNGYGSRDLSYYGTFEYLDGCGRVWQPYFTSAAWSPYANGIWAWYPGQGYSFVSPYPWGWLPFHSGDWIECGPQNVWAWRPGGNWTSLKNQPIHLHGPPGKPHPIESGKPGEHPLLVSNDHTLSRSAGSPPYFFFARDSAGLDVPRVGLGNLARISKAVEAREPGAPPLHFSDFSEDVSDPRVALRLSRQYGWGAASSSRPAAQGSRGGEARPVFAGAHLGGYNPGPAHAGGGSSSSGFGGGVSVSSGAGASVPSHVSSPSMSSAGSGSSASSGSSSSHK